MKINSYRFKDEIAKSLVFFDSYIEELEAIEVVRKVIMPMIPKINSGDSKSLLVLENQRILIISLIKKNLTIHKYIEADMLIRLLKSMRLSHE